MLTDSCPPGHRNPAASPVTAQMPRRSRRKRGYQSVFISYGQEDSAFVGRLWRTLRQAGVDCWLAPHSLHIGENVREAIDVAIRSHDVFLVILSAHSLASRWVAKEVFTAFEEEQERNADMICGIRLDDTVFHCKNGWAADIRRGRHMSDFSSRQDGMTYHSAVKKLLDDLKT
jgi:hypothetical protein